MGKPNDSRASVLARQRNLLVAGLGVTLVALLLNGAWGRVCVSRTVLVPTLTQESWVGSDGTASASYLIDAARYVADRLYNRSPANASLINEELLRVAHAGQYGALKEQFERELLDGRLKERDVATTHFPESVTATPAEQTVTLITTVATFVGDKRVANERLKVTISFKSDGGVPKWYGLREEPL
ncbi:hypothetical protein IP70_22225 [alpha proteobacterium AAP38]|nr:hypothetical protein IP70_22225 [alpha proteobacterium AAP38]